MMRFDRIQIGGKPGSPGGSPRAPLAGLVLALAAAGSLIVALAVGLVLFILGAVIALGVALKRAIFGGAGARPSVTTWGSRSWPRTGETTDDATRSPGQEAKSGPKTIDMHKNDAGRWD